MTALLELKQKIKEIYEKYDEKLTPECHAEMLDYIKVIHARVKADNLSGKYKNKTEDVEPKE